MTLTSNSRFRVFSVVLIVFVLLFSACESSSSSEPSEKAEVSCEEPQNPYSEGSGHYAGFEWAEEHEPASCGGNSTSFIEGCEEWQNQSAEYEACKEKSNQ